LPVSVVVAANEASADKPLACNQMRRNEFRSAGNDVRKRTELSKWGVQLISDSSGPRAIAAYQQLQRRHKDLLGAEEPLMIHTSDGRRISSYQVRVGTETRESAELLCARLREAGASCVVQAN
jgi:hypothetical protein